MIHRRLILRFRVAFARVRLMGRGGFQPPRRYGRRLEATATLPSRCRYLGTALVVAAFCLFPLAVTDGDEQVGKTRGQVPPADKWNPDRRDPLTDAWLAWKLGAGFFDAYPQGRRIGNPDPCQEGPFVGVDQRTGEFFRYPRVKPVVQFSCAVSSTPYEDALEDALAKGTAESKLQALAILMRIRAPSSVPLQRAVLTELQQLDDRESWQPFLRELNAQFEAVSLLRKARNRPPIDKYSTADRLYFWSIRALGVVRHQAALPRLTELSRADQLYTSLAAERSIEDFSGREADESLAECLLGWRYNAYERAGNALLLRNKPLLRATLLAATPPDNCRYRHALLLARCDEPSAVPLLCRVVGEYQMIDKEMFAQIARLGLPEHQVLIEKLPDIVRQDQQEEARSTVAQYLKNIGAR